MFELFGLWHLLLFILSFLFIYLAYLIRNIKHYKQVLFSISFFLFLMECFKQYYYYFILNTWSVWIIPFQLCSIPMYLFMLYPFYDHKWFNVIETFLITYTFLGALCALGYPEDMIKPQVILTIHSFLWHYILVFLSSYVFFSKHGDLSKRGFIYSTSFFLSLCLIAFIINLKLAKYGEISMFYINPYIVSNTPVFHTIGLIYGIFIQNIIYISTMVIVTYIYQYLINKIADHFY